MNSVEYQEMYKEIENLQTRVYALWVKSKVLEPNGIKKNLRRVREGLKGCIALMSKYKEVNTFGRRWEAPNNNRRINDGIIPPTKLRTIGPKA